MGFSVKIGRNEPCPCGSGKKYKKCCLIKAKPPENLLWRRLGDTYDKLQDKLMDFARETFGNLALPLAMDEFLVWPEEGNPIDLIKDHMQHFIPWFLFKWVNDPEGDEIDLPGPSYQPPAIAYLDEHVLRLNQLERKLIEATVKQPFSFYEVLTCRPGKGFRLKDILRDVEIDVHEKLGSKHAAPGHILLCRVVSIDQVAMLFGCSSMLITPDWKPEIIDFKKSILEKYSQITTQVISEYDMEIRELYLDIYESS